MAKSFSTCSSDKSNVIRNTLELTKILKDTLHNKKDLLKNGACKHDSIRLGLPGWKSRFYRERFGAETSNEVGKLQNIMVWKYLEGLCWVLRYYFSDVPSWSWYYPFHYAPFASDLKSMSQFKISFTVGKPLRPFDQLMAVLPPESSYALPKCYRKLMDNEESTKKVFDPSELEIDLTMHEMRRNTIRQQKIFLRNSNTLANNAAFLLMSDYSPKKLLISTSEIGGWLSPDDDAPSNHLFHSPIKDLPDITYDQTISAIFFNPEAVMSISRLLDNVRVPEQTITEADIAKRPPWHTYPDPRPPLTYNAQKYSSKPDALWKSSSPTTREEFKNAGTGWIGRGRGSAVATETQQIGRSRYGLGRGNAAETQERCSSYRRGFHGADMGQSRGSRFDDDGAYSFRPGGTWAGGGGGSRFDDNGTCSFRPGGTWARGGGSMHGRSGSRFDDDGAYSVRPGGTWAGGGGGSRFDDDGASSFQPGSTWAGGGAGGNRDGRGQSRRSPVLGRTLQEPKMM